MSEMDDDLEKQGMVDDFVDLMKGRFGDRWSIDDAANVRFSIEVGQVLRDLDGVHLIGGPELDSGRIVLNVWVDFPIPDLMEADQVAYDIFGRISEEICFAERRFERASVTYPFVTGSDRHGHVGTLVLSGPHAADFADRHQLRTVGDVLFQA
ncbi:MAG: hypothetical protein ACR2OO_13730 [Thermomicrobiales bacterium]